MPVKALLALHSSSVQEKTYANMWYVILCQCMSEVLVPSTFPWLRKVCEGCRQTLQQFFGLVLDTARLQTSKAPIFMNQLLIQCEAFQPICALCCQTHRRNCCPLEVPHPPVELLFLDQTSHVGQESSGVRRTYAVNSVH